MYLFTKWMKMGMKVKLYFDKGYDEKALNKYLGDNASKYVEKSW